TCCIAPARVSVRRVRYCSPMASASTFTRLASCKAPALRSSRFFSTVRLGSKRKRRRKVHSPRKRMIWKTKVQSGGNDNTDVRLLSAASGQRSALSFQPDGILILTALFTPSSFEATDEPFQLLVRVILDLDAAAFLTQTEPHLRPQRPHQLFLQGAHEQIRPGGGLTRGGVRGSLGAEALR